jgi:hypothetical protein
MELARPPASSAAVPAHSRASWNTSRRASNVSRIDAVRPRFLACAVYAGHSMLSRNFTLGGVFTRPKKCERATPSCSAILDACRHEHYLDGGSHRGYRLRSRSARNTPSQQDQPVVLTAWPMSKRRSPPAPISGPSAHLTSPPSPSGSSAIPATAKRCASSTSNS